MLRTVTSLPEGQSFPISPLSAPGAAQSDLLFHFCGRTGKLNSYVPSRIASMTAADRLESIIIEEQLLGFPPFGAGSDQQTVCFSEAPVDHLKWLMRQRGWLPWAVIFTRQTIYNAGGGPVWYARTPQARTAAPEQRPWIVRFEADATAWSDFVHEREWRLMSPVLQLSPVNVAGIITGFPSWAPRPVPQPIGDDIPPRLWTEVPHFYWDADNDAFVGYN